MTGNPFSRVRVPHHAPPSGGAERALRAGTKRRRRAIVVTTGTTVLVVVVALLPGSPSSIDLAPPSVGAGPPPPRETVVAAEPAPPPMAESQADVVPPLSAAPSPTLTATPDDPLVSMEPLITEPRDADGGPLMTRTPSFDRMFCTDGAQYMTVGADWCGALTGPATLRAGHRETFASTMCRGPASTRADVVFRSRWEVDARVVTSGGTTHFGKWRWTGNFRFPADYHVLSFSAGDCATWSFTWSGEDDRGHAVAPGAYKLYVGSSPDSDGLGVAGSLDVEVVA